MKRYTVLIAKEGTAYTVDVPALPGCHTWGTTFEEALAKAREAIELYVEELRSTGEPFPGDIEATAVAAVEIAA